MYNSKYIRDREHLLLCWSNLLAYFWIYSDTIFAASLNLNNIFIFLILCVQFYSATLSNFVGICNKTIVLMVLISYNSKKVVDKKSHYIAQQYIRLKSLTLLLRGCFLNLVLIGGAGGGLFLFTLFLLLKIIEKVNFFEQMFLFNQSTLENVCENNSLKRWIKSTPSHTPSKLRLSQLFLLVRYSTERICNIYILHILNYEL